MGICSSVENNKKAAKPSSDNKENGNNKDGDNTSNKSSVKKAALKEGEIVVNSNLFVNKTQGLPTENYSMTKRLGEGSYGVVWKVKHLLTGHDRAMKKILKNPKAKKETELVILNEIEILKKMDHPNIVKIFEFYNTNDGYYLITEFCDKGELFQEIIDKAPFSEIASAQIMFQILSAVNYCHISNIIHRDLKPENILIDSKDEKGNYHLKVIDFGTAKLYERNKSEKKVIGSSYYIAPEVLNKNYNEKCDLWSCGVILFILLSGRAPFSGDKDSIILEKIKTGRYDMTKEPFNKVSALAKDLIKKLLEMNVKKRLSAAQALDHSWFKKLDTRKYLTEVDEELLKNTIENLKKYNAELKLQQVVLAYLVHQFPQIEEIREINKIFIKFDSNSDGKLTKDEMAKGLAKHLEISLKTAQKTVDEIFCRMDNDNNGYLDFEEFCRAGIDKELFLDDEILHFAFDFFDKDGSGEITLDELKYIFCVDNDVVATEKLLKAIINQIDVDGDGTISFTEFKFVIEKILS